MEYERSRRIYAPEATVFACVADVRNLPTFVPTIQSAEALPEDRIRLRGTNDGHPFEEDGWLKVDPDRHRIEWGNDEDTYSGWMTITGDGFGDGSEATQVVTHLSLAPHYAPSGRPLTGESPEEPDPIEESLEAAMDSLRQVIEGTGGKEQPAIAL